MQEVRNTTAADYLLMANRPPTKMAGSTFTFTLEVWSKIGGAPVT
jgi:hypothetical protein